MSSFVLRPNAHIVLLDRDGVLNALVDRDGGRFSPQFLRDFRLYPTSSWLIRELLDEDFVLGVVTNQPDIGRGRMSTSDLEQMHSLLRAFGIHEIRVCLHSGLEGCTCRKPQPGMLLSIIEGMARPVVWMIGDRDTDIAAGKAINARTIRLLMEDEDLSSTIVADYVCSNHLQLVEVLRRSRSLF